MDMLNINFENIFASYMTFIILLILFLSSFAYVYYKSGSKLTRAILAFLIIQYTYLNFWILKINPVDYLSFLQIDNKYKFAIFHLAILFVTLIALRYIYINSYAKTYKKILMSFAFALLAFIYLAPIFSLIPAVQISDSFSGFLLSPYGQFVSSIIAIISLAI